MMLSSTTIGIGLSLIACLMNATGMNLQRLAGITTDINRARILAPLGIFLCTANAIPDVMSFGYAPQSMLAPMGAVTLLINLALAPVLHGESLTAIDCIATLVIVVGVASCILSSSGSGEDVTYSLQELGNLAANPAVSYLAGGVLVLFAALVAHVKRAEQMGRGGSLSTGFAYPLGAGLLGGCTVFSIKILGEVIGHTPLNPWVVGPVALCVAVAAVSQVVVNNMGLKQHSPKVLVPVFSSTFVVSNAVAGGTFFQDFASLSPLQWQLYTGGCGLIVAGVVGIAFQAIGQEKEEGAKKKR
jgi:magnesium transporter